MRKKIRRSAAIAITVALFFVLSGVWVYLAVLHLNGAPFNNRDVLAGGPGTRFIAHRGYSYKYFDNTKEAFEEACKREFFYAVETDVRKTADGVYVCSHADNPFSDENISIADSDFDRIKDLSLDLDKALPGVDKSKEYRIARFIDYLEICSSGDKVAVVELKQNFSEIEIVELMNLAFAFLPKERVIFASFDRRSIERVLNADCYCPAQVFASKKSKAENYLKMNYNICVNKKLLKKDVKLIKKAHKRNCFIGVYTIDDAEEAKRLEDAGVDFITTDKDLSAD